jgi:hypothetical protein
MRLRGRVQQSVRSIDGATMPMAAGPDELCRSDPESFGRTRSTWTPGVCAIPGSSSPITNLAFPLDQRNATSRAGFRLHGRSHIGPVAREYRPGDPSRLVGKRHRYQSGRVALEPLGSRYFASVALASEPDHGGCPGAEGTSDITVAPLTAADPSFFPAAAVWAERGYGLEERDLRHGGGDRACRDRTDTRDRRQSATGITGAVPRHDTLLDPRNLASDIAQQIYEAVHGDRSNLPLGWLLDGMLRSTTSSGQGDPVPGAVHPVTSTTITRNGSYNTPGERPYGIRRALNGHLRR